MDVSLAGVGLSQIASGVGGPAGLAPAGAAPTGAVPTDLAPAPGPAPAIQTSRNLPGIRDVLASAEPAPPNRIGSGILDRLDRIQARDLDRGARPSEGEPVKIADGTAPTGPADSAFDAQMDMLQMTFDHAVEVELAAKTGTGVSSSMNKLMSGS